MRKIFFSKSVLSTLNESLNPPLHFGGRLQRMANEERELREPLWAFPPPGDVEQSLAEDESVSKCKATETTSRKKSSAECAIV